MPANLYRTPIEMGSRVRVVLTNNPGLDPSSYRQWDVVTSQRDWIRVNSKIIFDQNQTKTMPIIQQLDHAIPKVLKPDRRLSQMVAELKALDINKIPEFLSFCRKNLKADVDNDLLINQLWHVVARALTSFLEVEHYDQELTQQESPSVCNYDLTSRQSITGQTSDSKAFAESDIEYESRYEKERIPDKRDKASVQLSSKEWAKVNHLN